MKNHLLRINKNFCVIYSHLTFISTFITMYDIDYN